MVADTFKEAVERHRALQNEMYDKMLALVKEAHPEIDYDRAKIVMHDTFELRVYTSNRSYYRCKYSYPVIVSLVNTDLGMYIKWAEEEGNGLMLIEGARNTILLTPYTYITDSVKISHFFSDNGCRRTRKRRTAQVSESSKGRYVTVDNRRIYLQFEGARVE